MTDTVSFDNMYKVYIEALNTISINLFDFYKKNGSRYNLEFIKSTYQAHLLPKIDELMEAAKSIQDNINKENKDKEDYKENKDYTELVKSTLEISFRFFYWNIKNTMTNEKMDLEPLYLYLDLVHYCADQEFCDLSFPLILIEEICATLTSNDLIYIITYLSERIGLITDKMIPNVGKSLVFLRICNDLQRRAVNIKEGTYRGELRVLLTKSLPLNDRSGVNTRGDFNLDSIPRYDKEKDANYNVSDEDKRQHKRFWKLINCLCNPIQLFDINTFREFQSSIDWVFDRFKTSSTERREALKKFRTNQSRLPSSIREANAKKAVQRPKLENIATNSLVHFLTDLKVFPHQLNDPDFQRTVLVQICIVLQFLSSIDQTSSTTFPVAARPPANFNWNRDQSEWLIRCKERAFDACRDSPFGGERFPRFIRDILKFEPAFSTWKNLGCSAYPQPNGQKLDAKQTREIIEKERKDKQKHQINGAKNKEKMLTKVKLPPYTMGSQKLSELWKLGEMNRNYLQSNNPNVKKRSYPDLDQFLDEKSKEAKKYDENDEYRRTLSWMGMRLAFQTDVTLLSNLEKTDIVALKDVIEDKKKNISQINVENKNDERKEKKTD
ncbi:hypothetical protein K502DRAFT_341772 [Neoconidiobolus thromboides FSU 785]|nr:hypothetical protein K502DRAFT_341772 [Neoconidiobolus thromboides FSU 785]